MRIQKGILDAIQDCEEFLHSFCEYSEGALLSCRLLPVISKPRLIEAHGAWVNDLSRVGAHEPNLEDGLDHFKRCGHLSFWLRRMGPIVEALDTTKNLGDSAGYDLSRDEIDFRELLLGYCNEYIAFDFSYQICKYYEMGKVPPSPRATAIAPSREYFQTMCQFLKYKNVSPHAMHLIFKSLFLGP
ncbi:hypothetical protein V1282_004901 [Nitrobacteraceae bacterium AZCC 2146]